MEFKKKRKLSEAMKPYVTEVFEEEKIPYRTEDDFLYSNLTNSQFHLQMKRAVCKKIDKENGNPIPTLCVEDVALDPFSRGKVSPDGKSVCFFVLDGDREAFLQM